MLKIKKVCYSLTEEDEALLKALAEYENKTQSEFIKQVIRGIFNKYKKESLETCIKITELFNKYYKPQKETQAEQPSLIDEERETKKTIEKPSTEREMDTPSKQQEQRTTEKMDNQDYIKLFADNQNPFTTEELKTRAIEYITTFGTTRQINKIEEIKKIKLIPDEEKERIYNQIIKIENYSIKNHQGTENGIDTLLAFFKNIK